MDGVVAPVDHRYDMAPAVVAFNVTVAPLQIMPSLLAIPLVSVTTIFTTGDEMGKPVPPKATGILPSHGQYNTFVVTLAPEPGPTGPGPEA